MWLEYHGRKKPAGIQFRQLREGYHPFEKHGEGDAVYEVIGSRVDQMKRIQQKQITAEGAECAEKKEELYGGYSDTKQ